MRPCVCSHCERATDQVLTSENCAQLVWVLITQFLPLDEDYLSEWAEEPERAIAEESASELAEQGQAAVGGAMESEEPDVRLATMGLLLALSEGFPEVVVPILGEGLTKLTSGPVPPLEAEAWIAVGGLGVHALAAAGFDVRGWVVAMLASPVVGAADGYAPEPFDAGVAASTVVGRRAAWCVGQLAARGTRRYGDKASKTCLLPPPAEDAAGLCAAATDALLHWLDSPDLAVKCTAAAALKQVIDDEGIGAALGASEGTRANAAVSRLLALAVAAEGPTRKWQAVNVVMSLLKMGASAGNVSSTYFSDTSLGQIMAAWDSSASQSHAELLQAALLDLLTELVQLLHSGGTAQPIVQSLEPAACHMIGGCFAEPDSLLISVGEQALELWLSLLRAKPAAGAAAAELEDTPLLSLYPSLLRLFGTAAIGDYLKAAMETLEEYALTYGLPLLANEEGRGMLGAGLAYILTKDATPPNSGEGGVSDVAAAPPGGRRERMTAGVLHTVRNLELTAVQMLPPAMLADWAAGRPLAPCADALVRGVLDERLNETVRGAYSCVWARLVLQSATASPDGWCALWDSLCAEPAAATLYATFAGVPVEELALPGGLLGCLLDRATEALDSVVTLPRRKLCKRRPTPISVLDSTMTANSVC